MCEPVYIYRYQHITYFELNLNKNQVDISSILVVYIVAHVPTIKQNIFSVLSWLFPKS